MNKHLSFAATASLLALMLLAATPHAHEGPHEPEEERFEARVLGRLDFPTTTDSRAAQDAFLRGMLLLHLFEYDFAEAQFREAQTLDPGFVMAYWGEAMVHNRPIWDQQQREAARAVLQRLAPTPEARAERTSSVKERDFLQSLEILYGEGPKADRDERYRRFLAGMAARYPDDHEVQLFHALAIMGVGAGVRDIPAYMESAAISQSVFYANREHPGAAHYLIHAVDDPVHAPLGLEAARALAIMAPDAGHSLHMTSHIFTALGMWQDVVVANTEAARVANLMAVEMDRAPRSWGHYNFWLLYGLLQQGRDAQAKALLTAAYEETTAAGVVPEKPMELDADRSQVGSLVQMWARYLIETGGADEAVAGWQFTMGDAFDPQLTYHYAKAMHAAEPAAIAEHLTAFRELHSTLAAQIEAQARQAPSELLYLQRLRVIEHELEAVRARASGDTASMLKHAREASRLEGEMPYSFGPPFVDMPSAQLLGEMLLALGEYDEAAEAFTAQLVRSRRRSQALLGLAKAERGRGDETAAAFAMAQYERLQAD